MSVIVEQLTKVYGIQKAIDELSFEAKKGEILGFLGPNGAGKTTTMKILTSDIPATEGKAMVCGFDVKEESKATRRCIGYLPEHNPLYKDMYVKEYLGFVARLHPEVRNKKQRVEDMIEQTGLGREQHKQIGMLSKGYRQRVGLAQAMLHDPEVLILDEPTSGLDPNQLVEIRQLIKQLGEEKTVILSTHIMQEVQAICDRVVIINKGKLVANDPIEQLKARVSGGIAITIAFQEETVTKEQLKRIKQVRQVKALDKKRWQLLTDNDIDIRPAIFHYAVENKLTLIELHQELFSIEDVFQELTK